MDDFRCPACGSSALAYPRVLEGNEPVVCANCGEIVSTYGELKRRSEQALGSKPTRSPVSGC
jgi:DNA-directed RNA polymerase subunit RPC12/RpoP